MDKGDISYILFIYILNKRAILVQLISRHSWMVFDAQAENGDDVDDVDGNLF